MKIVLLPLDERPCNTSQVKKIANLQPNIDFILPDKKILGNKKQPANLKAIEEFLIKETHDADILILSIDTLVYGGLLPSRLHQKTVEELKERLTILKKLKLNSKLKIYAFACIMRTPKYNSSDEEPDYYEQYGYEIFRAKFLQDKQNFMELDTDELKEMEGFNCPKEYIMDYSNRRNKNKIINIEVIKYLKNSIIDYLIIPQDDSAEFGYTRIDQDEILANFEGVKSNSYSVHPGADEVAITLLTRAFQDKSRRISTYVHCTSDKIDELIPNYEDRVASKTLKLHLSASNVNIVNNVEDAEVVLLYHLPNQLKMLETAQQDEETYSDINYDLICDTIKKFNKPVAIADCAYSNGGDTKLLQTLYKNKIDYIAYQAWNTNSNTLGSAIGNAIFALNGNSEKSELLRYEHIIEDGIYQPFVRGYVTKNILPQLGLTYFNLDDKQEEVIKQEIQLIKLKLNSYTNLDYDFEIYHPWNRMFEIGIDAYKKK